MNNKDEDDILKIFLICTEKNINITDFGRIIYDSVPIFKRSDLLLLINNLKNSLSKYFKEGDKFNDGDPSIWNKLSSDPSVDINMVKGVIDYIFHDNDTVKRILKRLEAEYKNIFDAYEVDISGDDYTDI